MISIYNKLIIHEIYIYTVYPFSYLSRHEYAGLTFGKMSQIVHRSSRIYKVFQDLLNQNTLMQKIVGQVKLSELILKQTYLIKKPFQQLEEVNFLKCELYLF
ncbi:Hypothetical_protein [Hexamita inflata]|uniref:Hypothetical_protein n=1 Tax=Hexamita inflata TaxID=28002 RepID=A0AA86PHX8_9EUKA|nr:Hypothetical protein HINF_LOCUS26976 [Hexamita inflata]